MIRIGFGGILYHNYNKEPPKSNPTLIIQAPTLLLKPTAGSQPPGRKPLRSLSTLNPTLALNLKPQPDQTLNPKP